MLRPPQTPNISPYLAPPEWVAANIDTLILLDGTFMMPTAELNATHIYLACHLPGAKRFDIDVIKDSANPLPHMLPTPKEMSEHLSRLGIDKDRSIVIYDQQGLFGAARVWWMLRAYGFENVFILDGGLPRWIDEERDVVSGPVTQQQSHVIVELDRRLVSDKEDVRAALHGDRQVFDARAPQRFYGEAPEPRPGMRSGHMPGAVNLPYPVFLNGDTLKPLDQLKNIVRDVGIDPKNPVISSCGSGVTAAMLCLVLASLGYDNWSLYDGSWAEWGSCADCDVVQAA